MLIQRQIVSIVLISLTLGLSSLSFGEDKSQSTSQVSPELRKDMADMYQKMAECLRTDKSLEGVSAQGSERLSRRCEDGTVSD